MSGIRSSRRAAASAGGALEVGAAGGDLDRRPAQRDRALRREVEAHELRRRQRRPRRTAAGASRSPSRRSSVPWRGDQPPLDRHRVAELDQLLVDRRGQRLPGDRPPPHAQRRVRAHRAPDQRVVAERVVERPQVVVDAGGEAHPRDPLGAAASVPRGRRTAPGRGAGCTMPDVDPLAAEVQQPLQRGAAPARQPVGRPAAEPERPRRLDLDADLDRAPGHALNPGAAGGRRPGTSSTPRSRPARSWPCGACAAARGAGGGETTATVAAPATKPGGGQRRRLAGGHRRGQERLDHGRGGRDGQPVDDLGLFVLLRRLAHERAQHDGSRGRHHDRVRGAVPNTRSQYGALTPKPRSSSWKWWRMCSSRSRRPTRVRGWWWCTA